MEAIKLDLNPDLQEQSIILPLAVADTFIDKILKPYRTNAKYLKSAEITHYQEMDKSSNESVNLLTAKGRFAIEESCYIDDTGHFNSVEFNICYNQLAYVMFGKSIEAGIFDKIIPDAGNRNNPSFDAFLKYQLSSMFIAKIEGKFLKPLDSRSFWAELSVNRISSFGKSCFAYTHISFYDGGGLKAKGPVLLAFSPVN